MSANAASSSCQSGANFATVASASAEKASSSAAGNYFTDGSPSLFSSESFDMDEVKNNFKLWIHDDIDRALKAYQGNSEFRMNAVLITQFFSLIQQTIRLSHSFLFHNIEIIPQLADYLSPTEVELVKAYIYSLLDRVMTHPEFDRRVSQKVGRFNELVQKRDELRAERDSFISERRTIESELSKLYGERAEIRKQISELSHPSLPRLKESLQSLNFSKDATKMCIDSSKKKLASFKRGIYIMSVSDKYCVEKMEKEISSDEAKFAGLEGKIAAVKGEISECETAISDEAKSQIAALTSLKQVKDKRVKELEAEEKRLSTKKISVCRESLGKVEEEIDRIVDSVDCFGKGLIVPSYYFDNVEMTGYFRGAFGQIAFIFGQAYDSDEDFYCEVDFEIFISEYFREVEECDRMDEQYALDAYYEEQEQERRNSRGWSW
jgi:hypothetical protein